MAGCSELLYKYGTGGSLESFHGAVHLNIIFSCIP